MFTTGEFANICNVKKQTLFHYDDIDLLKPEYVAPNGYRYYSFQQAEVFTVIEILKEIGMSLSDIKDFLNTNNLKETAEMLTEKAEMMQQKIEALQRTKEIIQNKKEQIVNAIDLDIDNITIEHLEREYYVLSKNILNSTDKEFTEVMMSFIKHIKEEGLDIGYPVGGVIPKAQIEKNDYLNVSHLFMRIKEKALKNPFIRKSCTYAVGYHKGSYIKTYETYEKMKSFIDSNGYQISGDTIEEYVIDGLSAIGEEDFITKIMIQVEGK